MDKKTSVDRLLAAAGDRHMPCGLCGAPIPLQETTLVLVGPGHQPMCEACAEKHAPALLYAARTAYIMAGEGRRAELLWEYARRQPAPFWEYEVFTRERGGPGGAPLAKDLLVEQDYREELLDMDRLVTVMISQGVEAEQAATVLETVARLIQQGGYPTFLRATEGRRR